MKMIETKTASGDVERAEEWKWEKQACSCVYE